MAHVANGYSKPKPAKRGLKRRACLRCDGAFLSEGPHHRLCEDCRRFLATASGLTDEYTFGHPSFATGQLDED